MKTVTSKQFFIVALITTIWVNASEIVRYFVLVRPKIKDFWGQIDGIAEMDLFIFSIWGFWEFKLHSGLGKRFFGCALVVLLMI